MAKRMNWQQARERDRQRAAKRKGMERRLHEWAVKRARRATAKPTPFVRAQFGHWPVTVTDGPHPTIPGALRVRIFSTRAEADAAGFSWVGR